MRAPSRVTVMSETRPDLENPEDAPRLVRNDRWLIGAGLVAISALAIALWSQAGRDVFSAAMAGLWALCF